MSTQQAVNDSQAAAPIWVVSRTEEGFQVYDAGDRSKLFTVSGTPEAPQCTCTTFQWHKTPCEHIEAVFQQVNGHAQEEAAANGQLSSNGNAHYDDGSLMMTLKRSVSPDGRIDSLSIEFALPVELNGGQLPAQAQQLLQTQSTIAAAFLNGNGNCGNAQPATANGPVPAQVLSVGGMNTKWGWRPFLNVSANGQNLRLFGTRKQLAEQLAAAGYAHLGSNLNNGVALNVPCRVTLKPSDDGKYVNVERLLPVAGN